MLLGLVLSSADNGWCQRIYPTTPIILFKRTISKKIMDFIKASTVHRNLGAKGELAKSLGAAAPADTILVILAY